jgi:hypothetical protein
VDNFYEPNDLGLMVINFLNLSFTPSFQSQNNYYGGDRMKAYPCYETNDLSFDLNNPLSAFNIFKRTFENKTGIKPLRINTFFRKTKLEELKKSPSWNQYKPHCDAADYDIAGIVYFNANSINDGTNFYFSKTDYEPTAVIGARTNRCVFYNTQIPHSPVMVQEVEERWIQPFFLIVKEETYKKFKEENAT